MAGASARHRPKIDRGTGEGDPDRRKQSAEGKPRPRGKGHAERARGSPFGSCGVRESRTSAGAGAYARPKARSPAGAGHRQGPIGIARPDRPVNRYKPTSDRGRPWEPRRFARLPRAGGAGELSARGTRGRRRSGTSPYKAGRGSNHSRGGRCRRCTRPRSDAPPPFRYTGRRCCRARHR